MNELEQAARKLVAEVGGLAAFELAVREAIGNTNYACLMQRCDELSAVLAAHEQPAREPYPASEGWVPCDCQTWCCGAPGTPERREFCRALPIHPDYTFGYQALMRAAPPVGTDAPPREPTTAMINAGARAYQDAPALIIAVVGLSGCASGGQAPVMDRRRVARDVRRGGEMNTQEFKAKMRERSRQVRAADPEAGREYARLYRQRNKELIAAKAKARRHTPKEKARKKLRNAIQKGRITKPTRCERCATAAVLHGHHHNYSKPLDVVWLCVRCHAVEHHAESAAPGQQTDGAPPQEQGSEG
jgi:hypothetical protein